MRFILLLILLTGCAARQHKDTWIGVVNSDVEIVVEDSFNQWDNPSDLFNVETNIPIEGVQTPINIDANRSGVKDSLIFWIDEVGGDLRIIIKRSGNQNKP